MTTPTARRISLTGTAAAAMIWTARHVSAPAVRASTAGSGTHARVGRTSVRALDRHRRGGGRTATLLLHGLTGSGDAFGDAFDALADDGPLLVPDLPGFGRSMDTDATVDAFGLAAHLDALQTMVDHLAPKPARLRIGGHSMGGVLAIHLAARLLCNGRRVDAVTTGARHCSQIATRGASGSQHWDRWRGSSRSTPQRRTPPARRCAASAEPPQSSPSS